MNDSQIDAHNRDAATRGVLAYEIGKLTPHPGDFSTAIPALNVYRRDAATEPMACIYGLGMGIVAQGGKQVMLGEEIFNYGPGQSLLNTVDLPVVSHVTHGTPAEPFLGLMLTLDARLISQLAAEMAPPPARERSYRAMSIGTLDEAVLSALLRLVRLLGEPALLAQVAPLVQQEITVRLLAGAHGAMLRQVVAAGSPGQQIARALAWLKQNFAHALRIDELADNAHMSPSTFRQHFRAIAGMSPLQYQKQLRLQEARQLMLNQSLDAGSAGIRVGYESASQFSREYSRLFGAPPQRDIQRLRLAS